MQHMHHDNNFCFHIFTISFGYCVLNFVLFFFKITTRPKNILIVSKACFKFFYLDNPQ